MAANPQGFNPSTITGPIVEAFKTIEGIVKDTVDMIEGVSNTITGMEQKYIQFFHTIGDSWMKFQDMTMNTANFMGVNREMADQMMQGLIKNTQDFARIYGVTAEEINKFQEGYVKATGRAILLTQDQIEGMSQMNRLAGAENASAFYEKFDLIGGGTDRALAEVEALQTRAAAMGLSAQKSTEIVAKNLSMASKYNFKDGTQGLERMALKAQSVRMSMENIGNAIDKFQTIEDSINTSAQLQMLGGNIGAQFANPMAALYEGIADPEGIANRLMETLKGAATFNTNTGQAELSPIEQMRMREAAKALGMNPTEFIENAKRDAINEEIKGRLNESQGFTDTDRDFIANKAQWNDKTHQFEINMGKDEDGNDIMAPVEKLTKEQVDALKQTQLTEEGLWDDVRAIRMQLDDEFKERAQQNTSLLQNLKGVESEQKATNAEASRPLAQLLEQTGGKGEKWWTTRLVEGITHVIGKFGGPLGSLLGGGINSIMTMFEHGGIVTDKAEPKHRAEFGTVVPGSSYTMDKVPVMANSGEMVLNGVEQRNLFNALSESSELSDIGERIGALPMKEDRVAEFSRAFGLNHKEIDKELTKSYLPEGWFKEKKEDEEEKKKEEEGGFWDKVLGTVGSIAGTVASVGKFGLGGLAAQGIGSLISGGGGLLGKAAGLVGGGVAGLAGTVFNGVSSLLSGDDNNEEANLATGTLGTMGAMDPVTLMMVHGLDDQMAHLNVNLQELNKTLSEKKKASNTVDMANENEVVGDDGKVYRTPIETMIDNSRAYESNSDVRHYVGGNSFRNDNVNSPYISTFKSFNTATTVNEGDEVYESPMRKLYDEIDRDPSLLYRGGLISGMQIEGGTGDIFRDFRASLDRFFGPAPKEQSIQDMVGTAGLLKARDNQIGGSTYVAPVRESETVGGVSSNNAPSTPQDVNVNINGSIRLESPNGGAANIDMRQMMNDPQFVNAITDIVIKRMSENANAGRNRKEGNYMHGRTS